MVSKRRVIWITVGALIVLGLVIKMGFFPKKNGAETSGANTSATPASLTVRTVTPTQELWSQTVVASGALWPWHEAIISSEISGLRIKQVLVDLGDRVKRGQVLVTLNTETVQASVRRQEALVAQARASLSEAKRNMDRARVVKESGLLSTQQIEQYQSAYETAKANVDAAKAQLDSERIKLTQSQIRAIDDGVISSRTATLGAVVATGNELFRLVRQERIEWRAEVNPRQLSLIQKGQKVKVTLPNALVLVGTIRVVAPTVDVNTRNAWVYVDMPHHPAVRAGIYVKGEIQIGTKPALTVPQTAVVMRDGNSYVFAVDASSQVIQKTVTIGRHSKDRVEIIEGLSFDTPIVATGGAFLNDGDRVKRIDESSQNTNRVKS